MVWKSLTHQVLTLPAIPPTGWERLRGGLYHTCISTTTLQVLVPAAPLSDTPSSFCPPLPSFAQQSSRSVSSSCSVQAQSPRLPWLPPSCPHRILKCLSHTELLPHVSASTTPDGVDAGPHCCILDLYAICGSRLVITEHLWNPQPSFGLGLVSIKNACMCRFSWLGMQE